MPGDLVILVPSREGVVAATAGGTSGDRSRPAPEPFTFFRPARVAFTLSGDFLDILHPGSQTRLGRWIGTLLPRFDWNQVVERSLRRLGPEGMSRHWVDALAARFAATLSSRLQRDPAAVEHRHRKGICCVVLVHFLPTTQRATIASFVVRVGAHGLVEAGERLLETFGPEDELALLRFGETIHLSRRLRGATGRRYMGESLYRRVGAANRISALAPADAAHIARALIPAASRTAEGSRQPHASEGVRILLIDGSDCVARGLPPGRDSE